MNLSNDSVKLLRWLRKNDEWMYYEEIERKYKRFDYRSFSALKSAKYIDESIFEDEIPEYDEWGQQYYPQHWRINDSGKAFLEGRFLKWLPELRGWVAVVISLFALLVSVTSLILR